jgi:hypothetical protein
MSIIQSRAIYKGGFNKEYFVDDMETSHILNVLVQLENKEGALTRLASTFEAGSDRRKALLKSRQCVNNDIAVLTLELASREDCLECC